MVRTPRTHSRSGKSPVTIDLEAEPAAPPAETPAEEAASTAEADVTATEAASSAEAPTGDEVPQAVDPQPAPRRRGGLIAAALAGGLIGIAGAAALDRYMPPVPANSGEDGLRAEIATLRSELGQRIEAVEAE